MTPPVAPWAEVWPSRLALEARRRELAAEQGGLSLEGALFTFRGRHGLLERLLAGLPLQAGRQPLGELAGPLLLHDLLQDLPAQPGSAAAGLFQGMAAGRRLPHALWRLLVQIKGAGLSASQVQGLAQRRDSSRLAALAGLLGSYQQALEDRSLADEADHLASLEAWLAQGQRPACLAGCAGLEVRQTLWLRPLELRLLRALARVLPVRVGFALLEPGQDPRGVFSLLRATANCLERVEQGLEVHWNDSGAGEGPLAGLARAAWGDTDEVVAQPSENLELWRLSGRYAEVEALVLRALEQVQAGVPPHEVALVFPDLGLYGPMAADVAARLGLPLYFRRGQPLAGQPLVQALLALLELPLAAYPAAELARVWESPYLARPLASWLLGPQAEPPSQAAGLLRQARYLDGQEVSAAQALRRRPSPLAEHLARACERLQAELTALGLAGRQSLHGYAQALGQLLAKLDIGVYLLADPEETSLPPALRVRDLAAWQALLAAQRGLEQALTQVGEGNPLTAGRCLALWREVLASLDAGAPEGQRGGVTVLRLEDAEGIRPQVLLVGGLDQGGFPLRPGQSLLARQERLDLGRLAGLPVWRTEDEEYGGQVLRLLRLLAQTRQTAVLACSASDLTGRAQEPSFVMQDLARRLGRELPAPSGGVYGELPPLAQAREPLALWGGLAQALLPAQGPEPSQGELAQAALYRLAQESGQAARWQSVRERTLVEQRRMSWDLLDSERRPAASDHFGGWLGQPAEQGWLAGVLGAEKWRRLSPSILEGYATCPMSWFLGRLLGLGEPEEPGWDLEANLEGSWVHRALALFFAPEQYDPAWSPREIAQRLSACLDQAQEQMAGQGGHALAWRSRRAGLESVLGQVVERECQDLAGLRPLAVETRLGREGQGLALEVDQGPPLLLSGCLDRLDQGPGLLRVTDYKHSQKTAALKAAAFPPPPRKGEEPGVTGEVTAFQLPVYLAAAQREFATQGQALEGRILSTRLPGRAAWPTRRLEPADPFLASDPATRQTLAQAGQANLANAVQALWARLSGGDLAPRPSQEACQYCPYRLVCRARPLAGPGEPGTEGQDA